MFHKKPKVQLKPHIKILQKSHEHGWDYVLINTESMQLRYQSSEKRFRRGHMEFSYREFGVVRIFQSVCPKNRPNGDYVMVTDWQGGSQESQFIGMEQVIALIVEYEEPYRAQQLVMELCGREIKPY